MKKTKILTIALLLATLAGCGKDNDGRIRVFADKMSNGNSKVLINPDQISDGAQWVAGEDQILLNNIPYEVQENGNGYYIQTNDESIISGPIVAFYPGTGFGGNDIDIVDDTIKLNRLVVEFTDDGQKIAFPMVATAQASDEQHAEELHFRHLTGGLRINLHNEGNAEVNLASVKIVAKSNTYAPPLSYPDDNVTNEETYTAKWAVHGPSVPTGSIGGNGDEVDVNYTSEMNFDFKSSVYNYVTVNGDLSFCIPVTISYVDKLVVTGYDVNGNVLFNKVKDLPHVQVVRNHMYDTPVIKFGN